MISGSGSLVLVVGSSGAGKDSVLRFARARLGGDSRFSFPKRVVTRPADTASEDHETTDDHGFEMLATGDVFALQWQAHDLKYGVRRTIEDDLAQGRIVSVNVSRTIVAEAAKHYPAIVVEIFADPDVLAARIAARGRESEEAAARRANRRAPPLPVAIPSHKISNSGELSIAGGAFCELLENLAAR